mmetsp:Transcript_118677/g.347656  ORF Transcript_118677/g.347656 Transcript_118677/m.347656 type:complete len:237 (+) Transcript_118677:561-1271(+)
MRRPISDSRSTMGSEKTSTSSVPAPIQMKDLILMRFCCSSGSKSARSSGMSSSSSSSSSASSSPSSASFSLPRYFPGLILVLRFSKLSCFRSLHESRARHMKQATNSSKLMKPLSSVSAASNIVHCASRERFSFTSRKIIRNSSKSIWLSPFRSYSAKKGARTLHILRTSSIDSLWCRTCSKAPFWQSMAQFRSRNLAIAPRSVSLPSFMAWMCASAMASSTWPLALFVKAHWAFM